MRKQPTLNKQYGPNIASLVHGVLPIILEENDNTTFIQDNKITGVVLGLRTEDIYKKVKFLKEKKVDLIIDEPTNSSR
ncbi:hypothetical protein MKZ08_13160 [Viridibacillus sp. FSL R5-0477]|uniref:Uncharacterized protein n=1 Tax=Viridibacillus arenosi FSL R5-213 TaxID=1227360 RepID=W4EJE9_9BACL|nr:hypothetical protein [Viridibacillus arenosi]ETT80728.1 hypothetical protein C176_21256 [Viridibacillus arenosi FSL R5-213]OMC86680.1 hypothetical protein BK137_21575 [Viridibacillus arenosi]